MTRATSPPSPCCSPGSCDITGIDSLYRYYTSERAQGQPTIVDDGHCCRSLTFLTASTASRKALMEVEIDTRFLGIPALQTRNWRKGYGLPQASAQRPCFCGRRLEASLHNDLAICTRDTGIAPSLGFRSSECGAPAILMVQSLCFRQKFLLRRIAMMDEQHKAGQAAWVELEAERGKVAYTFPLLCAGL